MKVALATCVTLPEPDADAPILARAFQARGIDAGELAWDDPAADWKSPKLVVVRSPWNYIHNRDGFLDWVSRVEGRVENHASVLRWNTHKRYLRELDEAGFPVVDTVLVPKGSGISLMALMKKKHWFRSVVKPAIGAGSFLTRVTGGGDDDEQLFAAAVVERDMLVQPFMAGVETSGERAIVYIDGAVTHAVRKSPRFSADREQTTHVEVAEDERVLAERVLHWVMRNYPCGALLYGRVDMVRDAGGEPRIMELELVEPSLFLQHSEAAVSRFVDGVERRLALLPKKGE